MSFRSVVTTTASSAVGPGRPSGQEDQRGVLGRDWTAARTTKGFSTAGFEGMWPRRYLVLSLGWPDGKGKGKCISGFRGGAKQRKAHAY